MSIHQKVIVGTDARLEMLAGAKTLADAVKSTMGPGGHSVIIDTGERGKPPLITKDGVTVARSVNLKNKLRSVGAELLKEIAAKTNEQGGDGTSTSTVLGYSLLNHGVKFLSTGVSGVELKKGMDLAKDIVCQYLDTVAIPTDSVSPLDNPLKYTTGIATISANGDKALGNLIARAVDQVGPDGIVTFEISKNVETTLSMVQGCQVGGGFVSPFFITNADRGTCEYKDPLILVTTNKISSIAEIVPVLNKANDDDRPLLIICDNLEGEALHTCVVNKTKGILQVCAVKAPSFGEHKADILADIAAICGAEVIGVTSATNLTNLDVNTQLGTCAKVIVNRGSTTFVLDPNNHEAKEASDKIATNIRSLLEAEPNIDDTRRRRYQERLARLSGGVAVIHVGGASEVEIREKKDRVEDAVNATLAAVQNGIVPGGGTALYKAGQHVLARIVSDSQKMSDDMKTGMKLVALACESPLRAIVENTGGSPDVVLATLGTIDTTNHDVRTDQEVTKTMKTSGIDSETIEAFLNKRRAALVTSETNIGYNAATGKFENLVEKLIVDPVKVTKLAITHAVSVISLVLTCHAVVINEDNTELEREGSKS